jgi:PilZ domain
MWQSEGTSFPSHRAWEGQDVTRLRKVAAHSTDPAKSNPVHPTSPGRDRREHERHLTIFRVAKLTSGDDESLCVARNLSSGGMMIEVFGHYEIGRRVRISLADDQYIECDVVWRHSDTIGVRFESEIDVVAILSKPQPFHQGLLRRMPRMQVREHAQLFIGPKALPVEICDISPRGVKIKTDHVLGEHEMVWLIADGLDPISGTLRWRLDGHAGIEFSNIVSITRLMKWLQTKAASQDGQPPFCAIRR